MGLKKVINKIKSSSSESNNFSNEEAMFRQLGIDDDMIKKLKEASLDAAKEKVKVRVRYVNNSDNEDLSYKYVDDSGI